MSSKLRVLSVATMFPNPRMPVHAQFVKQRLDALAKLVDLTVLSPIPWFPGEAVVNRYKNRHQIPREDKGNAYPTYFPRFISIPAVVKPLEGFTLAISVGHWLKTRGLHHTFDILDCHLAFPEGYAGALLKKWLQIPLTVTLRGHDINDLPQYPIRRRQVVHALKQANRYFGVAQALVDGAVKLGAPPESGFRSANGVDIGRFYPLARHEARRVLGLAENAKIFLSVSHLVARKGIDILLRAFAALKSNSSENLFFVVVGKGGEEGNVEPQLRALVLELGIQESVHFAGAVLNQDLYKHYSAADCFCLASEKEGWPNVLLESMACGTPVIAASTWGVPEVVCREDLGILVQDRNQDAFAKAMDIGLKTQWSREVLVEYARENTWDKVAEGLVGHFQEVISNTAGQKAE